MDHVYTLVGALKASTERFEGLKIRSIPSVVRVRARFGDNRNVLVKEHEECGVVRAQEVIERG